MCRPRDKCLALKRLRLVQSGRHTIHAEGAAYMVMIRPTMHTSPPRPSASVYTPILWALRSAPAMQVGKHTTALGGTAYIMTSGPTLAVHQTPAARLFAWAITNTSMLAQPVSNHRRICVEELSAILLSLIAKLQRGTLPNPAGFFKVQGSTRDAYGAVVICLHCTDMDLPCSARYLLQADHH